MPWQQVDSCSSTSHIVFINIWHCWCNGWWHLCNNNWDKCWCISFTSLNEDKTIDSFRPMTAKSEAHEVLWNIFLFTSASVPCFCICDKMRDLIHSMFYQSWKMQHVCQSSSILILPALMPIKGKSKSSRKVQLEY